MNAPRDLGRRRLIGGALAASGLGLAAGAAGGAGAAAPDGAFRAVPKQLQVFRQPREGWQPVAQLCATLGIGEVAIALSPVERRAWLDDTRAGIVALAPLRDAKLKVSCLVGDTDWLRNPPAGLPAELIETIHLHDKVFRFEALIVDVEPQAVPGWAGAGRAEVIRNTLALLAEARAACRLYDLRAAAALTPDFAHVPDPDRPGLSFLDSCLDRLDQVVLTSYRNDPDEALRFAAAALKALERRPIPVWFTLTTQLSARPDASYHGLGIDRFRHDVALLHRRLTALPAGRSLAGISIHQFGSLRLLAQA